MCAVSFAAPKDERFDTGSWPATDNGVGSIQKYSDNSLNRVKDDETGA